jgi:GT2 family glycosyltransferase
LSSLVGVVILNWNGLADTLECLASLRRSDYPDFRAIVVDNGSSDGSPEVIRRMHPEAELIVNGRNAGFAAGNNIGIRKALDMGADFVWLLNNDTVVEENTLSRLVSAAAESGEVALASPVIHYYDRRDEVQFIGSFVNWDTNEIVLMKAPDRSPEASRKLCLWGTALLIKRSAIERCGMLDEKYFAYHEDEEYSLRILQAGMRNIIVPPARIFHKNSRSTGSNDAPLQVFLRSRNLFFLWSDALKGKKRLYRTRKYLARIISYGGELTEKGLPVSVEALLDGVWHAYRGAGGPKNPELQMPGPVKMTFRFLFRRHPYLWTRLLRGDFSRIASDLGDRIRGAKAGR